MSEQTKDPSKNGAPTPAPEVEEKEITLEELDSLLAQEDPSFNNEFAVLRSEKFEVDIEVENFSGVDKAIESSAAAPTQNPDVNLKDFKSNPLKVLKEVGNYLIWIVSGVFGTIFGSITGFFGLSRQKKLIVLSVVALAIGAFLLIQKAFTGSLLPSFELKFMTSIKPLADRSFKIEPGEQMEDFDNPLRHPDFVVLIERLVVNLKSSNASENPMGMFEFYIEASSQEGAIEVNERQKEIRDLMARTLEQASYEDLASSEGKDRMKLTLRREINTLLTEGRARRVFFKTILLKP